LIIMGTHGRSGIAHVLMGSVAEQVVRVAPCPVLLVRAHEHAARPQEVAVSVPPVEKTLGLNPNDVTRV